MADTTPILLALPSLTPSLALEVMPYGLTVHRLFVQADGKTHDLVIGPEHHVLHRQIKYVNTIIGRYTNRLPVKEHSVASVRSPGTKSSFTPVPNESPAVSLHGGPNGFDEKEWEPIQPVPGSGEISLFSQKELTTIASEIPTAVVFKAVSEDGEQGFPGKLLVEVLVGLIQPKSPVGASKDEWNLGSLLFVYRAKLIDTKKTVTPINLTQHWGFNLDASLDELSGPRLINDHKLTIKGSKTLALHPDGLATGELKHHDDSSSHSFASHTVIGSKYPESGYDEFFVFDRTEEPVPKFFEESSLDDADWIRNILDDESGQKNEEKVVLEGGKSGIKLSFFSNQSGVQFYSNSLSKGFGSKKRIHGGDGSESLKEGGGYEKGAAAFLEFHEPYPAFLHPEVSPSGNDTLLNSGEVYNNFVKVNVGYKSVSL